MTSTIALILSIITLLFTSIIAWNNYYELRNKIISFYKTKIIPNNNRSVSRSSEIVRVANSSSLPPDLRVSSQILIERLKVFDQLLYSTFKKVFRFSDEDILKEPEVIASVIRSRNSYAEWGEKIDLELLLLLLRKRIENHNSGKEIIYSHALEKIDQLSIQQLKFIVLIQTFLGLIPFLDQSKREQILNLTPLIDFISRDILVDQDDIDHLQALGIIIPIFPHKWKISEINDIDNGYKKIIETCQSIFSQISSLEVASVSLTPVGRIIASNKIKSLLDDYELGFLYPTKELADLEINTLSAKGNVIAYSGGKGPRDIET